VLHLHFAPFSPSKWSLNGNFSSSQKLYLLAKKTFFILVFTEKAACFLSFVWLKELEKSVKSSF